MKNIALIQEIKEKFGKGILQETSFLGQLTLQVEKESLKPILVMLKEAGFEVLMDLSAIDYLEPIKQSKVFYWLHNPITFERIRVIVFADREEKLPSVTDLWEGASWFERELYDLFGIHFEGHPDLKRLLMPDDWIGHPLRKDYALTEEPVEFKNNVQPEIPSEIIHVRNNQKL